MDATVRALADYDALRVRRLTDEQLEENVARYRPDGPDGAWWVLCVHELAVRHPLELTGSELVAEHTGRVR